MTHIKNCLDRMRKDRDGLVKDLLDMSEQEKDALVVAALQDNDFPAMAAGYRDDLMCPDDKNACYQSLEYFIREMIDAYNIKAGVAQ